MKTNYNNHAQEAAPHTHKHITEYRPNLTLADKEGEIKDFSHYENTPIFN